MNIFSILCIMGLTLSLGALGQAPAKKAAPAKKGNATKSAPAAKKPEERKDNFVVTETQEARFSGTDQQLVTYFMENVRFDSAAVRANAEGQVMISFTVNADSSVTNPVLIQRFGHNVDEQVLALVQKLKFVPAKMNGIVIRSNHIITIPLRAYIR